MVENMTKTEKILKGINDIFPDSNQFKRDIKKIFRINLDKDLDEIKNLAKISFKDLTEKKNKKKGKKKDKDIILDFFEYQKHVMQLLPINDNIRNEFLNNENLKDEDTKGKYKIMLAHYVIINIKEDLENIIKEKSKNYNND